MNKKQYEIQYGKYYYSYTTPIPTPVPLSTATAAVNSLPRSHDNEASIINAAPTTPSPIHQSTPSSSQQHSRIITGPGSCIHCFVQYFRELTLYQVTSLTSLQILPFV
jgi:hypothetical protein